MKIIAFHAYLYKDNYIPMLTEQFRKLMSSGLYEKADKIYIGIVDESGDKSPRGADWIKYFWQFAKSKVEIVVYEKNNEETDTLKWIADYSFKNPEDYVLYFHTKGITTYNEATEDWRKYMEYFVVENWQDCTRKLDEGFDICGVLWNHETVYGEFPHFSGGMWWSKSDYINTLKHEWLNLTWRYYREFWIGSGKPKVFEFHNSRMNDIEAFNRGESHYSKPYPRENYEKNLVNLNKSDGFLTDKGVLHSYLPIYDQLFKPYRNKKINIFEVGYQYGGSAKLWELYFPYAKILSIDIDQSFPHKQDAINLGLKTEFKFLTHRVRMEFKDANTLTPEYFKDFIPDIAIDDGSHLLAHQLHFIKTIFPLMKPGGLLIIEDVQDIDNEKIEFQKLGTFKLYDFRKGGRTDDVIIIFEK